MLGDSPHRADGGDGGGCGAGLFMAHDGKSHCSFSANRVAEFQILGQTDGLRKDGGETSTSSFSREKGQ